MNEGMNTQMREQSAIKRKMTDLIRRQSCYCGVSFAGTQTREPPEQDHNCKPDTNLQDFMGNIGSSKSFYNVSKAFTISFFFTRIL